MSSNITKIHFSQLCRSIIDTHFKSIEEDDKFEIYFQLVGVIAYIWNVCSVSKNPQEAEDDVLSCLCGEHPIVVEELALLVIKIKFKDYRYDKNLILYTEVEEQDGDYKVYSYLVDEKEYDCPTAQSIYDEINSEDFQAEIAGLSELEKNKEISNFLVEYLVPFCVVKDEYTIENEDNPLDKVRVYSCSCGCGNSFKSFSLREIKNAYKAAKKELDEQFKQKVLSNFEFKSYDKAYLNNFEDYFRMTYVINSLVPKCSLDKKEQREFGKKASLVACTL